MTESRAELRAKSRARRAKQQRTDPATGELRVPLKDRVEDAFDDLDEASERRAAAERLLSRYLSGPGNGPDTEEGRRLADERDAAALAHELASNEVDRVRLQVRLYRAGGLPD